MIDMIHLNLQDLELASVVFQHEVHIRAWGPYLERWKDATSWRWAVNRAPSNTEMTNQISDCLTEVDFPGNF